MDRTLIVIVYGTDAFGNEVALTNLFPEDKLAGGTQVEIPEDVARLNHYFSISSKGRIKNPHFNDVEDRGMDKFFPKEP